MTGTIISGLFFDDNILMVFVIWAVGIFGAIMQNALFLGFANLIDNT